MNLRHDQRFTLERVSGPEIEPVTLDEMKRHLRAYDSVSEEDADIEALITAAREWVEDYTGRALVDQTWRLTVEKGTALAGALGGDTVSGFPRFGLYCGLFRWLHAGEFRLRKSPVLEITSFKSVDAAGVETDVDSATYALREADSKYPRLAGLSGATWYSGTFRITFRAGFCDLTGSPQDDLSAIPVRYKQAIKLWVEANYDRDPVMMEKLLATAASIVASERTESGFA